jgi:protein TonB
LTKLTDLPVIIKDQIMKKQEMKTEEAVNKDLQKRIVTHDVPETPLPKIDEPTTIDKQTGTATTAGNTDTETMSNVTTSIPLVIEPPKVFDTAEVMPQYEGGMKAMVKFLSKQLRYPTSERLMGHEGTVYVRFVINSAGQVVDVEVIKGVSAILDREAVRVVSMMTKWKPGMQHDLPVNVRMVLPIRFHMEQE